MSKIQLILLIIIILILSNIEINKSATTEINTSLDKINIDSINSYMNIRKLETFTNKNIDMNNNTIKENISTNSINCNIKNCEKCKNANKCLKCKDNYKLLDNHCYNTQCQIFGFCSYCNEFDCIQCLKGYKLNFGTCDRTVNGFKIKLIFGILIPTLVISAIIYLYIYLKKKNQQIIESGKVINLKHPLPGNYIILPETHVEEQSTESFSKSSNITQTNESTDDGDIKNCIVCGKKTIYAFADCGCGLCKEHWKYMKNNNNEKIMCRKHGTPLKSIIFSLDNKSNIKGHAVEKLGLKICPVCKINNGTQSFNCQCNTKICEKCFNDNVYFLQYNQCPGCGMPFNPQKENKIGFNFLRKRIKGENNEVDNDSDKERAKSISSNISNHI